MLGNSRKEKFQITQYFDVANAICFDYKVLLRDKHT